MKKSTKVEPPVVKVDPLAINLKDEPRTYYTVKEVAESFRVSIQTVLQEIHEGRLQALKIRKCYRIGKSDLERYKVASLTGQSNNVN